MGINRVASLAIWLYRAALSPYLGQNCRYYPSCSEYAKQCYAKYTFTKASRKVLWRLMRCQPFSGGGIDLP